MRKFKTIRPTSQAGQILKHLQTTGTISFVEAVDTYGCRSLTRRITDLREAGHEIISETKKHPMTQQRYVRYHYVAKASKAAPLQMAA